MRATDLSKQVLAELARLDGDAPAPEALKAALRMPATRADAGLLAYGRELLRRVEGKSRDEVSLALWRRFACDEHGAPLKGFELKLELFPVAERRLLERRPWLDAA